MESFNDIKQRLKNRAISTRVKIDQNVDLKKEILANDSGQYRVHMDRNMSVYPMTDNGVSYSVEEYYGWMPDPAEGMCVIGRTYIFRTEADAVRALSED